MNFYNFGQKQFLRSNFGGGVWYEGVCVGGVDSMGRCSRRLGLGQTWDKFVWQVRGLERGVCVKVVGAWFESKVGNGSKCVWVDGGV